MKLKGFSNYEIYPEEGKVFSYKSNRFIGYPNEAIGGYWQVTLYDDNGKEYHFLLHRLIWEAVNGAIPENMQINHLDENTSNNVISNLSLCTPKENINFGTGIQRRTASRDYKALAEKLSNQVAAYKNGVLVMVFPSTAEAQRQGFHQGNISACCNGIRQSHKGYQWRFLS